MNTVRPELEELEKRLEKRWPGLFFFNSEGGLNDYGKLAKSYLELEEKKEIVTIDVVDCVDKHHYHIKLSTKSPDNKMVCAAFADIHEKGGSVATGFFDKKMKDVKGVTIQLLKKP